MTPGLRDAADHARADAAALGLSALAGVVAGAQDGIAVIDVERRVVYANPAACEMFGYPLQQLRGRDFLSSIPVREHPMMAARFAAQLSGSPVEVPAAFTCSLRGPDGTEREIVYSRFAVDAAGSPLDVAIFRDLTGPRAAGRAAAVLAQTASRLVGAETAGEILAGLARHAVEGTRALSCGITTIGEDHKLDCAGGWGPDGPGYGEANPASIALADVPVEQVIEAMTGGGIVAGDVPGKPIVIPDARAMWEASPLTRPFAVNLSGLDWRAGVFLPLSWQNRVFGFFAVFLVTGLTGPSEEELAFYSVLSDQAAVAVTNSRLASQARQAAALEERARLARELHDSVSQGLFSMTMHARAAQVSMAQAGLSEDAALGRSIAELAELTRGALAEMRALIFELRPAALAEEGLVAALRKQAAALAVREGLMITVDVPEERLALEGGAEEHLYRIASEAVHNVVNHAGADRVTVRLIDDADQLRMEVHDDGVGFIRQAAHPGHHGLSMMAQRAATVGGDLSISSMPGTGTTVVVSVPKQARGQRQPEPVSTAGSRIPDAGQHLLASSPIAGMPSHRPQVAQGGSSDEFDRVAAGLGGSSALADAAALGVPLLAAVLAGAQEGIAIANSERRWIYVNPAACQLLGRTLEQLRGMHILSCVPAREHDFVLGRVSDVFGGASVRFGRVLIDAEGVEHDTLYSIGTTEIAGILHAVAIFRDVTGPRAAARTAVALAQAASQLVGTSNVNEILSGIARHAVEGTRALVCGISTVDDDDRYAEAGGFGPWSSEAAGSMENVGWAGFEDLPHGQVISALTGGSIVVGKAPGKPLVLPDVRSVWMAYPILEPLVATLNADLPGGGIFFPLFWEGRVFGLFTVCLPPGISGPNEAELAFCAALADQATIAVTNARLTVQAERAAALLERGRLARELHDSVSQAFFSMTMHARAAQLAMTRTGLKQDGALGQSIAELAQLARGAMAEMRALIFELQPAALAEEGLVAALGKQAAALSAREKTIVTSQGPTERLKLRPETEEHLYRIASEALHNVINHAQAQSASVSVIHDCHELRVEVSDDGTGFDQNVAHPGHLGLSTMAERAQSIGATLAVSSTPGTGTSVVLTLALDGSDHARETANVR